MFSELVWKLAGLMDGRRKMMYNSCDVSTGYIAGIAPVLLTGYSFNNNKTRDGYGI